MTLRDAVIPAGGTIDPAFAARIGTEYRALAPFGPQNRPVLQLVINALRESRCVRHIIAVAAPPVQSQITGIDLWLDASGDGPANILRALSSLDDPDTPALICASDLPFLTPDAVDAFAARCDDHYDLSAGLISQTAYEMTFPLSPPSIFTPLRGAGNITLSGLFCARPRMLLRNHRLLTLAMAGRKHPWQMARLLGTRLMIAYVTRTLHVGNITRRVETLLKCRAHTFPCDFAPSLACDMDTEDDYTYARTVHAAHLVS